MIYVVRPPEPVALSNERQKANGSYREASVVRALEMAFYNRCYLCEDRPQSINVEHLKPHRNDPVLKLAWTNLFWSCSHCNNIKSDIYEDVLDCTIDTDVEKRLNYKFDGFPLEEVEIEVVEEHATPECQATKELLEAVFNGSTIIKRIESNGLRKKIAQEITALHDYILRYDDDNISDAEKQLLSVRIQSALSEKSTFASFKRAKIRSNPKTYRFLLENVPGLNF